jgi:hypothetical protein
LYKSLVLYPLNEAIDRYTIHQLKHERTDEPQDEAMELLKIAIEEYVPLEAAQPFIGRLYEINGKMWDTEAQIRAGEEEGMGLAEVGRRALIIRNLNRKRIAVKNEIVERFGSGFRDVKVNYAGATDGV